LDLDVVLEEYQLREALSSTPFKEGGLTFSSKKDENLWSR
jgi:hypothetical protein